MKYQILQESTFSRVWKYEIALIGQEDNKKNTIKSCFFAWADNNHY